MESTVGVVRSDGQIRWVRHQFEHGQHRFSCGELSSQTNGETLHALPRLTALGLDAAEAAFRVTSLPFEKREQIRQVLPQEATESLVYRPTQPHLAFVQTPNGEGGSDIFYAVADLEAVEEAIGRYSEQSIRGNHYWISEAACWPLLKAQGFLTDQESVLVVDYSSAPSALLWIDQGQLKAVRTVSAAAREAGELTEQEELQWLIDDQLRQLDELPARVVLLNVSTPLRLPMEGETSIQQLSQVSELVDGAPGWDYLRPAGLAVAMSDPQLARQMLDFRTGKLAGEINWKSWLAPWRAAAMVLLMVGVTGVVHQTARYLELSERSMQLSQQMREQFQEILPQVPMVDPVAQVKQAYNDVVGSGERPVRSLGQWIALIQTRVPEETKVQWKQLLYDNGQLQLIGEVPSYDHLDKVQSALKATKEVEAVEMEKAQILSRSRHVQFNLKVM